jgi:hypothetical protein
MLTIGGVRSCGRQTAEPVETDQPRVPQTWGAGRHATELQASGSGVFVSRDAHRHVAISQVGGNRVKAANLLKISRASS